MQTKRAFDLIWFCYYLHMTIFTLSIPMQTDIDGHRNENVTESKCSFSIFYPEIRRILMTCPWIVFIFSRTFLVIISTNDSRRSGWISNSSCLIRSSIIRVICVIHQYALALIHYNPVWACIFFPCIDLNPGEKLWLHIKFRIHLKIMSSGFFYLINIKIQ